jgi:hypothetical protein
MPVTVTFTELDINTVGGALVERGAVLSHEVARLITEPKTPSRDFAIECNADALRQIVRVQLIIAAALERDDDQTGDHYAGMPATGSGIVLGTQTYEGMD